MGYSALFYICVALFFISSCDSSNNKTAEKNKADSVKQSTIHTDTADTINQKTVIKDTVPPELPSPPDPAIAPGTLRLQGEVVKIHQSEKDSSVIFDFKVLHILGIGSATPAVVRQDTIQIASVKRYNKIKTNEKIICTISNRQLLSNSGNNSSRWQLIRWEPKPDQQ